MFKSPSSRPRNVCRLSVLAVIIACIFSAANAAEDDLDWKRVNDLFQRDKKGEKLAAEDQAYLDHAKEVRKKLIAEGKTPWRDQPNAANPNNARGGAMLGKSPTGLVPLTELGTSLYKGEDGGL